MTIRLNPYLNFRDQSRAALEFYHSVLGGELTIATFGDYGMSDDPDRADLVMHGHLVSDAGLDIMASDTPPGGDDPTLVAHGLATVDDPQEGAAPSGTAALARAALLLHQLTAEPRYRALAEGLIAPLGPFAVPRPIGFGATLAVATALAQPSRQLVVVSPAGASDDDLTDYARHADTAGTLALAVTSAQTAEWVAAGFELLADRVALDGRPTAYLCTDFVCRLPVTSLSELTAEA